MVPEKNSCLLCQATGLPSLVVSQRQAEALQGNTHLVGKSHSSFACGTPCHKVPLYLFYPGIEFMAKTLINE